VTVAPMVWLVTVTMTASYQKIFSANPRIGFLSFARLLASQVAAGKIPAAKLADTQRVIFNQRLDAVVTAILATMVTVLIVEGLMQWYGILSGKGDTALHETPYVRTRWAPEFSGGVRGDV